MSDLRRSHRMLALIFDWGIVIGLVVSALYFIGLPSGGSIILIVLIFGMILAVPTVYFKIVKWGFGMTLGVMIVIGLRRLYHRIKPDSERTKSTSQAPQKVTLCPRCENEISLGDKFCSECGKDLT